jgi:uncharacterized metal-binding protein YceD (DUF177 family)
MTALRDWTHLVTDVGERGLSRTREATSDERVELARELDIPSCERLAVRYDLRPRGAGRYTFMGTLEAAVTQACVVSLEPVGTALAEAFSIDLAPAELLAEEAPETEREVSSIADVETIEDGCIDVGRIVFGLLSAALDPYPRKEGVDFDWVDPKAKAGEDKMSPFAALERLKPKP